MQALLSLSPELVWGLFTRGLGIIFLISFVSLATQVTRVAGRLGGIPFWRRLAKMRQDFPTARRFYYFPTLLWLSDSDRMLRLLTWMGIAGAAFVIYGGPFSFPGLLCCYVCYLSLDMAVGLIFPWDCLAFECIILSLFLPATHPLPDLAAVSAPVPALTWAYRILLFRLMLGFGKQKFIGSKSRDLAYLKGFLTWQPLPSPIGWYAQKLPVALLKPLVVFMFLVEIPVPFFVFFPGALSIICALSTAFLMVGIQAMGSFGYFSMATIVLCITLLDNTTPALFSFSSFFTFDAPVSTIVTNAYVMLHTMVALAAFPFNSWIAQSWHLWSLWYRLPAPFQLPFAFFRLMHPFRWVHPYGVFPPNTNSAAKFSLLVEVTWDRKEWHELEFPFSPSNSQSPPKFVSPHHPRGDQAVIYETFGLNPASLVSSMMGPYEPYAYGMQPAAKTLQQRLLEGLGDSFMVRGPLDAHSSAPVAARITTVMLDPASLEEHRKTGAYWRRSYVGPHSPPRELDPDFWKEFLPEPEMWHFEAIFWRRRSRLSLLMTRARQSDVDPMTLAIADAPEFTAADVDLFWNEFIPSVGNRRGQWDELPDIVDELRTRYTRAERRKLHRLLGRFSLILVARLEPLYLGRGFKPLIPAKTYFHLWMLVHHVLCEGRESYVAALGNPLSLADRVGEVTTESGLYLTCLFRFEAMIFEAQKLRLIAAVMPPHDAAEKARFLRGELVTEGERRAARFASMLSGFFDVMPAIRNHFRGPRYDHGYPERPPKFEQLDSGEVILLRDAEQEPPVPPSTETNPSALP